MPRDAEVIRSRSNPALKRVGAALAGKEAGVIVLEGERLVRDAIATGHLLELVLVAESKGALAEELEASGRAGDLRRLDGALLAKVSGQKTPPGVVALAREPEGLQLEELELDAGTLLLVIAGVADPGNAGALARSAEAAGARAVVFVRGGASPWNAKALRGSMGSLLRLPIVRVESAAAAADALAARDVRQVAAATRGGTALADFDWSGPIALWVGAETGAALEVCARFEPVTIPMRGAVESLNVTVAASLLLYAAGRTERDA
ncbi:MAG: RNA methyltransferase [bacterium]|nr:RNA methyltransferase [bacterium]